MDKSNKSYHKLQILWSGSVAVFEFLEKNTTYYFDEMRI